MRVRVLFITTMVVGCDGGVRLAGDRDAQDVAEDGRPGEAEVPDRAMVEDGGLETADADAVEVGDGPDEADALPDAPACVPTGMEACDGLDNDCDGTTDEGVCALAPCIGTIRSTIPGFEEARIGRATFEWTPLPPSDEGHVTLGVGGVGESLTIELTIPPDWAEGTPTAVEVRLYEWLHDPFWEPRETYSGSGPAGVDYFGAARLRGWFDVLVSDGTATRTVRGIFEAVDEAAGAVCRYRRCLEGERLTDVPCCCPGEILPPGSTDPHWCVSSIGSFAPRGDRWLQACAGDCPTGYVCAAELSEPDVRLCRPACTDSGDCAAYEVCVEGACLPRRCDADRDCGPDRVCVSPDPGASTPYCSARVPEPASPDPCAPDMVRQERGFCARECSTDGFRDCPAGWVCEHLHADPAGGFSRGWCAPDCVWRGCGALGLEFQDALHAARACTSDADCGWARCGDEGICCGLWNTYWAHCGAQVAISPALETPLLETLNLRWIFLCDIWPDWSRECTICDWDPYCDLRCDPDPSLGPQCAADCS
ncbi:MAG: hypothetical protein JXB32_12600 [Deltaproteobacteria bacterium]|nr:hypothetical protein [Deltaproteobacteria bacterium]